MTSASTETSSNYIRRAQQARKQNRIPDAITFYKQALSLDGSNVEAQQALGELYFQQKDYQLAKQRYIDALKLNPDAPLTHFRLGRIADILGSWEEAITYYEHSAYLNPKDFKSHEFLGEGYFFRKQLDKAKANYEKAREKGSPSPQVRFKLGQIARQQKDEAAAVGYFQEAIHLNKDNSNFHQLLGEVYFAQQKYDLAKASYQNAVELGTLAPWVRFKLGRVAQLQNDAAAAQSYFQEAIALNPKNPQFHYYLGTVQAQQSNIEAAKASYEKALSLKPNHAPSKNRLKALGEAAEEAPQSPEATTKATTTIESFEVSNQDADAAKEVAKEAVQSVTTAESAIPETDLNPIPTAAQSTAASSHNNQTAGYKIVPTEANADENEPHPNSFVEKIWQRLFG